VSEFLVSMEISPLLVYCPFHSAPTPEHLFSRGHHDFDGGIHVYLDACLPLANTGQPSIIDSGLGGLSHVDNLTICEYDLH
jgi:hypothetical protein